MNDNDKTMPGHNIHQPPPEDDGKTMPGRRDANVNRRFEIGDVILSRYEVQKELGQGGMGVVYKCFDQVAGIEVALKALPPEVSHDTYEMEDIKDNFQLVHNLHHPGIASYNTLERDNANGNYYLIMECVNGEDMRRWLRRQRKTAPLTPETVLPILRQVASALDYAHGERIIHRDIKPGNIMIDVSGHVKVLDFGLAAQIHTSMTRVSATYHGTSGTGPYMAPEQWRGEVQSIAADQYALAVMAYEMLAGHVPFEGTETDILRGAVLNETPRSLEQLSGFMNAALLKALAKDPKDRFPSCMDFINAMLGKPFPVQPVNMQKPMETPNTEKPSLNVYQLKVRLKHKREQVAKVNPEQNQAFSMKLQTMEENAEAADMALEAKDISVACNCYALAIEAADWILTSVEKAKVEKLEKYLSDAKRFADSSSTECDWSKVLDCAEAALKLDADNMEAQNFKSLAKENLKPAYTIVALADGKCVTPTIRSLKTPLPPGDWPKKLEQGKEYAFELVYRAEGGMGYAGNIAPFICNWKGPREARVTLKKIEFNGNVALPGNVSIKMIRIEPDTFIMAHKDGENYGNEKEHQVTLTKAYWLGKTPVTQGQWERVMCWDNPSHFKSGSDFPVEQVSWDDIQLFLKKLNGMYAGKLPAGYKFDLPTEAQWEYAAQGGHKRQKYTKYAGSDDLDEVGWHGDNSGYKMHPVGEKRPNELGLYDMSGNVWEWCSDLYGDYTGDAVDPKRAENGSNRVLRGGSWNFNAGNCRCAYRNYGVPSFRYSSSGFRLALVPVQ